MPRIEMNFNDLAQARGAMSHLDRTLPGQNACILLDNGVALYDFQRWYEQHLPDHQLLAELQLEGYELVDFADLDLATIESVSEHVEFFPFNPDHFEPQFRQEPENPASLAEILGDALLQNEEE